MLIHLQFPHSLELMAHVMLSDSSPFLAVWCLQQYTRIHPLTRYSSDKEKPVMCFKIWSDTHYTLKPLTDNMKTIRGTSQAISASCLNQIIKIKKQRFSPQKIKVLERFPRIAHFKLPRIHQYKSYKVETPQWCRIGRVLWNYQH